MSRAGRGSWLAAAVLAVTVGQLLVATLWPGLERFASKAFAARLLALLMLPFAIDVTGNTLDLYDSIGWWDDANHFVN